MIVYVNDDESRYLWIALNNLQDSGLHRLARLLESVKGRDDLSFIISDWISQTQKEYEVINLLKAKFSLSEKKDI